MAWTYAQLKAALAALDPQPSGNDAQATAINAQTTTATSQRFAWSDVKLVARISATGDWSRVVARSRQTPTLPPATGTDVAILAAINAVESEDQDIIDPSNAALWGAFQAGLAALVGIGDLAPATVTAIGALATTTTSTWQPAVIAGDCQTAEAQP